MSYYSSARSVSDLKAHLVLTTKYRRKVLSAQILETLKDNVARTLGKWGCEMLEFNGESDHVHLLFRYYPSVQLSKLVNNLKTVSSRKIRKEFFNDLTSIYGSKKTLWNSSYMKSLNVCYR